MLYCIIGNSGVGKDTILNKLLADKKLRLKKVVTCTTRPMRDNEVQGENYHFVSKALAFRIISSDVVEARKYKVANGDYWYYFTPDFCLTKHEVENDNLICVTAPEQFMAYYKVFPGYVVPIVIKVHDKIRLIRSLQRENNPDCKEICRRFLADIDSNEWLYKDINDNLIFYNDNDVDDVVESISESIYESNAISLIFKGNSIDYDYIENGSAFTSLISGIEPDTLIKYRHEEYIKMEEKIDE